MLRFNGQLVQPIFVSRPAPSFQSYSGAASTPEPAPAPESVASELRDASSAMAGDSRPVAPKAPMVDLLSEPQEDHVDNIRQHHICFWLQLLTDPTERLTMDIYGPSHIATIQSTV